MTSTILASFPSPSQGVWHLGFVPIRAYALCIIAGIIAALIIGDRRWVARGGERGVIYDIALWAVPFGLIGGRLYHVLTDWSTYFGAGKLGFVAALRIWDGGLGIWGAVALGAVGAWIGCRIHGVPLPAFGDAVAPGIVLAQAIGRLGNYFNQELYGRETTLPWGLEIFERRDASGRMDMLNGVSTGVPLVPNPVHPTFLYELLWNLLVFAVLIWVDRRFKLGHGRLFALYVAGYCVGRFWIELMRSDYATLIAGIRVNTFTSTFVFIGAVIYIMAAAKGREDPETLRSKLLAQDEAQRVDTPVDELAAVGAAGGAVAGASAVGTDDEPDPRDSAKPEADPEDSDAGDGAPDAEAEDQAEVDDAAEADEPETEPEAGLGAVDGEEVAAAEEAAPEVHEAVVEQAEEAEGDAEVEAEDEDQPEADEPEPEPEAGLGAVDGEEVAAAEETAPDVHEAVVEQADAEAEAEDEDQPEAEDDAEADEPAGEPEAGLGAVDSEELAAAEEAAPEVHEAVVEQAEEAEADAEVEAEDEDQPEADEPAAEPEAGLGAVDGEEVAAAEEAAPEVHEAVVEQAEEAEADAEAEVEDEDQPEADEPAAEPEAGLGAVDGEEVAAAEEAAPEVHEAVVEQAEEAEADNDAEAEAEEPAAEVETDDDAEADGTETDAADEADQAESDEPVESTIEALAEPDDHGVAQPRRRWWRRRS